MSPRNDGTGVGRGSGVGERRAGGGEGARVFCWARRGDSSSEDDWDSVSEDSADCAASGEAAATGLGGRAAAGASLSEDDESASEDELEAARRLRFRVRLLVGGGLAGAAMVVLVVQCAVAVVRCVVLAVDAARERRKQVARAPSRSLGRPRLRRGRLQVRRARVPCRQR